MPLVQVIQSRKSLGIQDLENIVNSQIPVGAHMLGSLLDYPAAASSPSGEVQYLQIKVTAGVILDDMQYFLETGGSASRNVRMGLYEQADPTDRLGIPTNRVAQTNQTNTTGAVDQFKDLPLTDAVTGGAGSPVALEITVDGFYWIAFVADNPTAKYAVSPPYRSDYLPVRRETGIVATTLPAVAGVLTNPVSSLVYVAAIEVPV